MDEFNVFICLHENLFSFLQYFISGIWPTVFIYTVICGIRHDPDRKLIPRQTICSGKILFKVYLTEVMILSAYQLYAQWNYLTNYTGYDMIFCKSLEQITWILNYFMTSPYKYAEHRLRKPPDG